MDDLITRLRFYGEPNPPATPEQLQALSRELERELDPFLVQLYLDHDGQADGRRVVTGEDGTEAEKELGFLLMPVSEVLDMHGTIRGRQPGEYGYLPYRYAAFWQGDEWMACFLDGPLRGKVFRCAYDGGRAWIPLYRSPRSFCEALVKAVEREGDGSDDDCTYSVGDFADHGHLTAPPEGDDPADTAAALQLIEECRTRGDRDDQAFLLDCAAVLLPHHDAALLDALANDESPLVRDAVQALLRKRHQARLRVHEEQLRAERQRVEVPRLVELIRTGPHPKKSGEGRELLDLLHRYHRAPELAQLGIAANRLKKGWQYRKARGAEWEFLPA